MIGNNINFNDNNDDYSSENIINKKDNDNINLHIECIIHHSAPAKLNYYLYNNNNQEREEEEVNKQMNKINLQCVLKEKQLMEPEREEINKEQILRSLNNLYNSNININRSNSTSNGTSKRSSIISDESMISAKLQSKSIDSFTFNNDSNNKKNISKSACTLINDFNTCKNKINDDIYDSKLIRTTKSLDTIITNKKNSFVILPKSLENEIKIKKRYELLGKIFSLILTLRN